MFKTITKKLPQDKDYPERSFWLDVYTRILNGTFYDHLEHPFHIEKDENNKYIRLLDRRPSVRYPLAKIVVDSSVSLLFSESHFPTIDSPDPTADEVLKELVVATHLNEVMIRAATMGSVGSVAILMQVLDERVFYKPLSTIYLNPVFDPLNPDQLQSISEKFKVHSSQLIPMGYNIDEEGYYWWCREWTCMEECAYQPWSVNEVANFKPKIDKKRTVYHGLGFVPIVWIRNLPNGNDIDGECTFRAALDSMIEIDYQFSQVARGLRYSSDPTLLIKEPALGQNNRLVKDGTGALLIDQDGDAKYLEINGQASGAVLEFIKLLREFALEGVHGNRVSPEKMVIAQSGRAMEMMNQPLVWLSDRLRITYGNALLQLLKMALLARHSFKLKLNDKIMPEVVDNIMLSLRWPVWYPSTSDDKQKNATTLHILLDSGVITRETAVKSIASEYDIQNVPEELAKIEANIQKTFEQEQPKVTEVIAA